ncbi:MAG: hypothetical protein ABIH38_01695 [Patescibacteria group bacterium]
MEIFNKKIYQLFAGWLFIISLTLNISFFHNAIIGVLSCIGFFIIFSFVLSKLIKHISQGRKLLAFIIVFTSIITFCLFFVYFLLLSKMVIIISLWVTGIVITGWQIIKKDSPRPSDNNDCNPEPSKIVFNNIKIFFPFTLLLFLIQFLTLFKIKSFGPIYNGFIPDLSTLMPYILGGVFFILFISIFSSIRSRYLLFIMVILFIVSASAFIIISQNLYGADSWRHFAIEKYISLGNRYEPTNIAELLQFKSEKIPNASLYTIIPVLYHLTYLPIEYIHKFFQLLFLAPLLLLTLYFGILDFIKNKQQSLLFVLVLLLSPGLLYVGQYNSVQAVGIVYFFINLWLWLRFLLEKTDRIPWYNWTISFFTTIAYPTTGYFSFITILIILLLHFFKKRNYNFRPFIYGLPLGLLFAFPIPLLDILFKKIPINTVYTQNWSNLSSIIAVWWKTMFPIGTNNPGLFPFIFILMFIGLIWLYKREKNRIFPLLLILLISLQVSQWSASIFQKDRLGIFTGRVQVLLDIFYYIVAFTGLRILIIKMVKSRKKLLYATIGTTLALLFVTSTNIARYNFAWSISNNELNAINFIRNKQNMPYLVLTDEVTSAAGSAVTNLSNAYYWYPDGDLYLSYVNLLKSPTINTLESICQQYKRQNVYFIDTPIPITTSYSEAQKNLQKIMSVKWTKNLVKVMVYNCQLN